MNLKLISFSVVSILWAPLTGEDVGIWFRDVGPVGGAVGAYQVEDEIRLAHSTSYLGMEAPADRAMVVRNVTYPSLFVTGTYSISWGRRHYEHGIKLYDHNNDEKLTDYDYTLGDGWLYISEFGWLYIRHYPWVYSVTEQSWQFFVAGELMWDMNTYYIWTIGKGWSWNIKWHIRRSW